MSAAAWPVMGADWSVAGADWSVVPAAKCHVVQTDLAWVGPGSAPGTQMYARPYDVCIDM